MGVLTMAPAEHVRDAPTWEYYQDPESGCQRLSSERSQVPVHSFALLSQNSAIPILAPTHKDEARRGVIHIDDAMQKAEKDYAHACDSTYS